MEERREIQSEDRAGIRVNALRKTFQPAGVVACDDVDLDIASGELLVLLGAYQVKTWVAVLAATGIVLGAAYMLWLYQRVMFGKLDKPENEILSDLNLRELATFVPLIILAFWIGLYPKTFMDYLHEPVNQIVERVRPGEFSLLPVQAGNKE